MEPPIYATKDHKRLRPVETAIGTVLVEDRPIQIREAGLASIKLEKIPLLMWKQVVSFLIWSYDQHKQEAMIHGYYNEKPPKGKDHWIMEPPFQEPNGMTVGMHKSGPEREANEARIAQLEHEGWILRFTAHHHCAAGASQSGTDKQDEHSKPSGYHVTLGNMDKRVMTFHHRAVIRIPGIYDGDKEIKAGSTEQYEDFQPYDFIQTPVDEMIEADPDAALYLLPNLKNFFLTRHTTPFPEGWKHFIDVPVTFQGSGDQQIINIIKFLSSEQRASLWKQMVRLSTADRAKGYSGSGVPEVELEWHGLNNRYKRRVYDALYRVLQWYVPKHVKGEILTFDELCRRFLSGKNEPLKTEQVPEVEHVGY